MMVSSTMTQTEEENRVCMRQMIGHAFWTHCEAPGTPGWDLKRNDA